MTFVHTTHRSKKHADREESRATAPSSAAISTASGTLLLAPDDLLRTLVGESRAWAADRVPVTQRTSLLLVVKRSQLMWSHSLPAMAALERGLESLVHPWAGKLFRMALVACGSNTSACGSVLRGDGCYSGSTGVRTATFSRQMTNYHLAQALYELVDTDSIFPRQGASAAFQASHSHQATTARAAFASKMSRARDALANLLATRAIVRQDGTDMFVLDDAVLHSIATGDFVRISVPKVVNTSIHERKETVISSNGLRRPDAVIRSAITTANSNNNNNSNNNDVTVNTSTTNTTANKAVLESLDIPCIRSMSAADRSPKQKEKRQKTDDESDSVRHNDMFSSESCQAGIPSSPATWVTVPLKEEPSRSTPRNFSFEPLKDLTYRSVSSVQPMPCSHPLDTQSMISSPSALPPNGSAPFLVKPVVGNAEMLPATTIHTKSMGIFGTPLSAPIKSHASQPFSSAFVLAKQTPSGPMAQETSDSVVPIVSTGVVNNKNSQSWVKLLRDDLPLPTNRNSDSNVDEFFVLEKSRTSNNDNNNKNNSSGKKISLVSREDVIRKQPLVVVYPKGSNGVEFDSDDDNDSDSDNDSDNSDSEDDFNIDMDLNLNLGSDSDDGSESDGADEGSGEMGGPLDRGNEARKEGWNEVDYACYAAKDSIMVHPTTPLTDRTFAADNGYKKTAPESIASVKKIISTSIDPSKDKTVPVPPWASLATTQKTPVFSTLTQEPYLLASSSLSSANGTPYCTYYDYIANQCEAAHDTNTRSRMLDSEKRTIWFAPDKSTRSKGPISFFA